MPKITIEYEHPHELTDLLGKLMQMYVVPEAICGDGVQYPENYNQGESVSVLEAKLKGAEERALLVLEKYHVVCDELHCLRKKLAEEHKSADKYHDVLNQIYDLLIPKDANPQSLPEFTVDHRMNDFTALIEVLISESKQLASCKEKLINTQSELDAAKIYIDCLESKRLGLFIPSFYPPNGYSFDSNHAITTSDYDYTITGTFKSLEDNKKDNSAFIVDTDKQLFTLEEAAEYLEVDIKRVLNLMGTFKIKSQGFLLSDLRELKPELKRRS